MRETKFRAWQRKMGVMLYSAKSDGNTELFDETLKVTNARYSTEIKVIHDAVLYESAPDMGHYGGGYWDDLFTEECEYMQFTGVHDKNGKDIWECDILQHPHGEKFAVLWKNSGFWVATKHEDWGVDLMGPKCDVIGNILENPELLPKTSGTAEPA